MSQQKSLKFTSGSAPEIAMEIHCSYTKFTGVYDGILRRNIHKLIDSHKNNIKPRFQALCNGL